jgi:hypothetical protein
MNVISKFSKGCKDSVALNACKGSGKFCSKTCPFHVESTSKHKRTDKAVCYTNKLQRLYPKLNGFLNDHSNNFTAFLHGILADMKKIQDSPWIRFSSFGSFPERTELNNDQINLLSKIAKKLEKNIKKETVHFPVETVSKYAFYKSLGFPVRLSNQSEYLGLSESKVIGNLAQPLKKRIAQAQAEAKRLRKNNLKVVVCPAIAGNLHCGNCKACSCSRVDVIVYPVHV